MFSAIRKRLAPKSVRARLTFWYLLTLGATLAVYAVFVLVVRGRALYRELDAELEVGAHRLVTDLRSQLLLLDVSRGLEGDQRAQDAAILVREGAGAVLFRSAAFPKLPSPAERDAARAARQGTPFVTLADRGGISFRIATLAVERPGAGPLVVQVAASTTPIRQTLTELAATMALSIVIVLVMASYGSSFTARRALAPVDAIVDRVRRIQASRMHERLDVRAGSAELDRLVLMLNQMLDRIETSVRSARRFAADASHELQTPITAMRSVVDLCLRGGRSVDDYQVMAADLLTEIDRLSALVRDLRLLALAEAGHLMDQPGPVDLAQLVTDCVEIARALAEDKRIHIDTVIGDRPMVRGSALHLRRVVLNLAHNAIRYSPSGSRVVITIAALNSQGTVMVRDSGC
ncbi:MAG: hypothetical protein HYX76_12390, partial [Acidobacteria bacterium]|nr:hypothetical protein [Acidobacteriota bacterium]